MASSRRWTAFTAILAVAALAAGAATAQTAAPDAAAIRKALGDAHAKFAGLAEGKNADYIPALAKVDPKLFGIALVTTDGQVFSVGDSDALFSIQSISKVFTLARVIEEQK